MSLGFVFRRAGWAARRWLTVGLLSLSAIGAEAEPVLGATKQSKHGSVLVFGDSYSAPGGRRTPSWSEQLQAAGDVRILSNLAKSGATAGGRGGLGTFKGQVDAWLKAHGGRKADTTLVFFGYNDVKGAKNLAGAKAAYAAQVDRLIRAGVLKKERLLLVQLHDWSRNPAVQQSKRSRVLEWNRHVATVAKARPGVAVVDLFTLFERVFARPGQYGLTNLTRPDYKASAKTALFADGYHFGAHGQRIIADAIKAVLARRTYKLAGDGVAADELALVSA